MGELIDVDFGAAPDNDDYICPAFTQEAPGYEHGTPCAQLLESALNARPEFPRDERVVLCAASLSICDELTSVKACGFQKFTSGTVEEQVRIRSIAGGAQNA